MCHGAYIIKAMNVKKGKGTQKNFSIDDLAAMVAKGFNGVDEKFNDVNKRFDGVNKRFDGVDKEISELSQSVKVARRDILYLGDRFVPRYEFDSLLVRFRKLEERVMKGKLNT